MTKKEKQRRMVHEVLVILGLLALLTFICRLWPILLLIILGIFVAALRLLFLSSKKVEVVQAAPVPKEPEREPTEKDVKALAFSVILRRITELVADEYPDARWVWESSQPMQRIEAGEDMFILLNRAGGYRRAKVVIKNLQVLDISYQEAQTITQPAENPGVPFSDASDIQNDVEDTENENYELLAFEWVEAHSIVLNERCNEAIGRGDTELILSVDELPVRDSWPDVCRELQRSGLSLVECVADGIKINLTQ